MDSITILDEEDINFLWNIIQEQQIIFHPHIAANGKIDYQRFWDTKIKKPFILFIDRNILISLIKFCEKGSLKDKGESQLVGVIMAWAQLYDISISAGLAIRENASKLHSEEAGLIELQKFLEVFDYYFAPLWFQVATGNVTEIPPITYTGKPAQDIIVNYADSGDHYEMALASLLHVVSLYRNNEMTATNKFKDFFKWTCDHLLVSEYLMVYAAMLFAECENIKAPKNANSYDLDKIVSGCENQAWDISYLTNWSTLYSYTDAYKEEFLFATNDILLKRIFVNKHGVNGLNGLLYQIFSLKEYNDIMDCIENRMLNRIKPDFGDNPHIYFQSLIDEEINCLRKLLNE